MVKIQNEANVFIKQFEGLNVNHFKQVHYVDIVSRA